MCAFICGENTGNSGICGVDLGNTGLDVYVNEDFYHRAHNRKRALHVLKQPYLLKLTLKSQNIQSFKIVENEHFTGLDIMLITPGHCKQIGCTLNVCYTYMR